MFFGFCESREDRFDNFNDLNGIYKEKAGFFEERIGVPPLQLVLDLGVANQN
jgi:hypothetical protein